jgi:hypothetical protein
MERDEDQENILQDIISGPEDIVDVTTEFLNNSGEGDESLNRRDGSDEVEPDGWGGEEVGEGEAEEGEAEGSGGTLNVANSGEVHIHILMKPKIVLIKPLLSIYIY